MKEHIVNLTEEVRTGLESLVWSGTRPVQVVRRAQILLKSDLGLTDGEVTSHVGCSDRTVADVRKRFWQGGRERALFEALRPDAPLEFSVAQRQQVVALACSNPPAGRARWTPELLREKAAEHGLVDSVSKSEVSL
jgi:hypothetical protein